MLRLDDRRQRGLPRPHPSRLALAVALAAVAMTAACRRNVDRSDGPGATPATAGVDAVEGPPAAATATAIPPRLAPPTAERLAEYTARAPKTVLELQLYRESSRIPFETAAGAAGEATLIDVNPRIGAWFVLELRLPLPGPRDTDPARAFRHAIYHLENPDPGDAEPALDAGFPDGLVIGGRGGGTHCRLWAAGASTGDGVWPIDQARAGGATYGELCGGRLYLRNHTEGRKTRLEMATDLLRDSVWGGEKITTFVRQNVYQDRFLETSEILAPADPATPARPRPAGAPRRPLVDGRYDGQMLEPAELGLELDGETPGRVRVGRWYAVRGVPGVFVSTIQPRLVAPEVVAALDQRLNSLDEVESAALVYMVAFDLAAFDVGFALGTDHPRVGWSERALPAVRDDALPGPDGFDDLRPLVRTGMLSPAAVRRAAATFTGGFKRSHGAFKHTALATTHSGSHYGFVEHGAVASKLVPGLATAVVWDDGTVELLTWSEAAEADLGRVRHARQNGVPLIEPDPATGEPRPGALVPRWGEGNWSGSQDKRLRSLRAGLCLRQEPAAGDDAGGRFLIYGYFSGATPSAMATVFAAYGCRYAMMLDMNALEHTYLALYRHQGSSFLTQHLIRGMDVLDESVGGQQLPRFVAFADNRDFFYLLRKGPQR